MNKIKNDLEVYFYPHYNKGMIIPVRCTTCGKVIANKWAQYEKMVAELEAKRAIDKEKARFSVDSIAISSEEPDINKLLDNTNYGAILDKLGLTRMCCRSKFLCHVDLIKII